MRTAQSHQVDGLSMVYADFNTTTHNTLQTSGRSNIPIIMKHSRRPTSSSSQVASMLLLLAIALPPYLSLSRCSADDSSNPIYSRHSIMTADNVSGGATSLHSQNEEELFAPSLSFESEESSELVSRRKSFIFIFYCCSSHLCLSLMSHV